ncbi:sigma-70 family RNA polymerase sigma factor [Olsenella profusa]|uniref:RNA polymerase sigma factor n=1 Tax=Olsenella profusa TaxID=138595 RepID=UPI00315ABA5A
MGEKRRRIGEKNARTEEAERLVGAHYADVLRYCRAHAPAGLAEDAAQETFLRFVRARSHYRERGRARAYLVTIARNVCADLTRGRAGGWDELPESLPGGGDPADADGGLDLAAALARLPRTQREALELRYGQGLKVGEVASVLGVSRFAAARTLSSALEALRASLGASDEKKQGGRR